MEKPKYEHIRGLSPTIAIEQKSASHNPRSTVGTVTEIYDYLRVLYARAGEQRCHLCGGAVAARSAAEIVDELLELPKGTKVTLLAPKVEHRKGEFRELLDEARQEGFVRARIDGMVVRLEDVQGLEKLKKHTIELVIDRLTLAPSERARLTDSVETALRAAQGAAARARRRRGAAARLLGGARLPEVRRRSARARRRRCCRSTRRSACARAATASARSTSAGSTSTAKAGSSRAKLCGDCGGLRLRPESRAVFLADKSICDATGLTVAEAQAHFRTHEARRRQAADRRRGARRRSTSGSAS